MELDLTEVAGLLGKLDEFGHKVEEAMMAGLKASGEIVEREAKRRMPYSTISRRIATDKTAKRVKGGYSIWIKSKAPHGVLFELGTGTFGPKGRRIYPKNANHLTFIDPRSGKFIQVKSTAGMKAKPFMKPALASSIGSMMREYQKAYNEKIK